MKILFLTEEFPPISRGGSATVAHNLVKGLLKKGNEIFVVTTVQKKSEEGKINLDGLDVFRIYAKYHERWKAWLSLYNPRAVSRVEKIIKEIKPDIVHAHNIHYYLSYHCLKIARKYAKGVFLTAHDVMLVFYEKFLPRKGIDVCRIGVWEQIKAAQKRYNPFRNIIIRHYLKYVDKIFAVSNSLKELLNINGIKNVETVYNGINIDEWEIEPEKVKEFKRKYNLENKKILFFGGRLSGAKGGDQLLEALALVKKQVNDVVLLVGGKRNEYLKKMEKLVKKLGLGKNVIFIGWLKMDDLKIVYHAFDICLVPSICFETFAMANLEAMAAKKPVVSGCFGGPKEVVANNKTGYLINPYNIELMTEKIIDLLKNPEKAKKFGEEGYQRAKEFFSLEKQVKKTLKWYEKCI